MIVESGAVSGTYSKMLMSRKYEERANHYLRERLLGRNRCLASARKPLGRRCRLSGSAGFRRPFATFQSGVFC